MNKISTQKDVQVNSSKKIQTSLGPKASTLEFLRNFARLYDPNATQGVCPQCMLNGVDVNC